MPEKYLKIKSKLMKQGNSKKAAEISAAKIYNSQLKAGQKPVGRGRK